MTPSEEYAALIAIRDARHAAAQAENARLREEVKSLVGITMTQQAVDRLLGAMPAS